MKNTEDFLKEVLGLVKKNGGEAAEIVFSRQRSLLKRIWYGRIHQNPAGESYGLNIGIIKNGRYVSSAISTVDKDSVEKTVKEMISIVPNLPESDLPKLSDGDRSVFFNYVCFDHGTARLISNDALPYLSYIKNALAVEGITFSGKIVMTEGETWFANSNNVFLCQFYTGALLNCYAFPDPYENPEISSYASSGGISLSHLEVERVVKEVLFKSQLQTGKQRLNIFERLENKEVEYDAIFEPYALAPIIGWMAQNQFNGLNYLRGSSALAGKLNEIVTGRNVSIADDPLRYSPQPFDYEGYPKRPLVLVDKGVLKNVALDSCLASLMQKESTGHALPPTAKLYGAVPSNISLDVEGVSTTVEEMINKCTEPTIWVTKSHYIAMPHFQSAEVTGTTQHGVFLIDKGQITPVYNLRFKQKMFEAFSRVEVAGPVERVYDAWDEGGSSPFFLPALKIKKFKFLGGTSLEN